MRTYRMSPGDLVTEGTYGIKSDDVWDGDDVEYGLQRADWEQAEAG